MSVFKTQLQGVRDRMAGEISERDVLRVSGALGDIEHSGAFERACQETLRWVSNRAGTKLPEEAWDLQEFATNLAGRNVTCRTEDFADSRVWAIRCEEPDKTFAGRVWKTEIMVEDGREEFPRFSLRLRVTSTAFDNDFTPAVPGLVRQLIEHVGLRAGTYPFTGDSVFVNDDTTYKGFVEHLLSETRETPLVVLSQIPNSTYYSLKPLEVAKKFAGMAHVYSISNACTWNLSDELGKQHAVFDGGVMVYWPGFSKSSKLEHHRLLTRSFINTDDNFRVAMRLISRGLSDYSLKRHRMGRNVVSFAQFDSDLQIYRLDQLQDGAQAQTEVNDRINVLLLEIEALKKRATEAEELQDEALDENERLYERAEDAEARARNLSLRVQNLENAAPPSSAQIDSASVDPDTWSDFSDWVDQYFAGRVVLTGAAKRELKKTKCEAIAEACTAIRWLANQGREGRIQGSVGTLREAAVSDGIRHAHCGGDAYDFDHEGVRRRADWHIKNGGNTRTPERCLRIYFAWDPESAEIIVSHMPSHRRTGAT